MTYIDWNIWKRQDLRISESGKIFNNMGIIQHLEKILRVFFASKLSKYFGT